MLCTIGGLFPVPGWENVYDGVCHFLVRIKSPIPSYMRFGKVLVHFRHDNQPRPCHTGHLANACHTIICHNCEQTGHLSSACPDPVYCNIYKAEDHKAKDCPYSWPRDVEESQSQSTEDATPVNDADATPTDTSATKYYLTEQEVLIWYMRTDVHILRGYF